MSNINDVKKKSLIKGLYEEMMGIEMPSKPNSIQEKKYDEARGAVFCYSAHKTFDRATIDKASSYFRARCEHYAMDGADKDLNKSDYYMVAFEALKLLREFTSESVV